MATDLDRTMRYSLTNSRESLLGAGLAVGGDVDEFVMLARRLLGVGGLADRGSEEQRPVTVANEVRLLLRPAFINPFEPVVDCDDCPVWPDRFEECSVGDFLYPGVDRRGAVFGPVWSPSPADHVGPQKLAFLVEEGELCRRCGVVAFEWLIPGVVQQGVGDAQRCHKVVNASVLGKASAHG